MSQSAARVQSALRSAGALTSAQLQETCGLSQASVSRALAPLLAAGEVLRVGRGRSQAYVMPRHIEGVSATSTVPIIKISADGTASEFGTLVPTVGGRYWVEEFDEPLMQLHEGLPWFLADMRPQGFLGRAFAHSHAQLHLAQNPDHWTDEDVLKALCQAGEDLPGNLIVGAQAFERYCSAGAPQRVAPQQYAQLAEAAMRGALPGSSAGGEQPKFCAVREDGQPVIVKFSPAGSSPAERRWADLLVCEHLALTTLREAGVPAAKTRILEGGHRVLLEVERFDRTVAGRVGMVSLLAFDNEYIGQIDNWGAAAQRISTRGLLRERDAERLRFLEAFGRQIGNTDRHYGNISLLIDQEGKWELAPAYDMLPMIYAPVAGEIVGHPEFHAARQPPSAETLRAWAPARELAARFWARAASDQRISAEFRQELARHASDFAQDGSLLEPVEEEPPFQRERPS